MKEKDFDMDLADEVSGDGSGEALPPVAGPESAKAKEERREKESVRPVEGQTGVFTAPPVRTPATFNPVFWGKIGETKGNGYVHKTYGHYVDGAGTFVKTVDFDKDGRIVATSVVFAPGVALDGFRLKKQK